MYLLTGFILTVFSIIELINKGKIPAILFKACWLLMTVVLCIRFGQGTDYFGYWWSFSSVEASGSYFVNQLAHGELGWYMLSLIFVKLHLPFTFFIGFVGLVSMLLIYIAINKHVKNKILCLLIFYPEAYLTYCCSGIRQGLVLCFFLAFMIDMLLKKQYIKYYVFSFLMMQFHAASIVLFVVPVFLLIKIKVSPIWYLLAPSISVALYASGMVASMSTAVGSAARYAEAEFSYLGLLLRVVLFFTILFVYKPCMDKKTDLMFDVYHCGFLVYLALFLSSTLSQRLTLPLKAVEILLIPTLLYSCPVFFRKSTKILKSRLAGFAISIIIIMVVMYTKNLNSYIKQGGYPDKVTILNYPYVSVFNANEIYKYRTVRYIDVLRD